MKRWHEVPALRDLVIQCDADYKEACREMDEFKELDPDDFPTREAFNAAYQANWQILREMSDRGMKAKLDVHKRFFWGFMRHYDPARTLSAEQLQLLWDRPGSSYSSRYASHADCLYDDLIFACKFAGIFQEPS